MEKDLHFIFGIKKKFKNIINLMNIKIKKMKLMKKFMNQLMKKKLTKKKLKNIPLLLEKKHMKWQQIYKH